MKDPSDVDSPIPMRIRATARGDQFTVVQRTFRAPFGGVVMRVTKDIPYRHRQLLQQLWGNDIVGVTGNGELRSPGDPDAADDDRQRQLPAVPPAMIPGLAPGGFGVNRGMRHFPGQPMFLVPDTPVGAQGRTVDSRRVSLGGPGLKQLDQMAAQTPDQGGQPRRQCLKASFPGTSRRKTPVLRQQGTNPQRDRIVLFQKVQQGIGRIESPNDHDDERLDKELVGIGFLAPALAFGRRRGRWNLFNKPEYADKDAAMG